jgi:hypothetical protein
MQSHSFHELEHIITLPADSTKCTYLPTYMLWKTYLTYLEYAR